MILDLPPELIQIIIDNCDYVSAIMFGFTCHTALIFQPKVEIIDMIETLVVSDFDMLIFELENWLKNRIQLVCAIAIKHDRKQCREQGQPSNDRRETGRLVKAGA